MNDSWETFAAALDEESSALQQLNAAAVNLTGVLVNGTPDAIMVANQALNTARAAHQRASSARRGMQARGFGKMTLQQVCSYAPRHLAVQMTHRLAELTYGSVSLGITIGNNKSLIVAGLERLMKVTAVLQQSATERTGVYKRRGFVAPPGTSVLVSSRV